MPDGGGDAAWEADSFLRGGNRLELAGPPAPQRLVCTPKSAGMLGHSRFQDGAEPMPPERP